MSHNQNMSSDGVWPHSGLNDFEEHRGCKESCCCQKSAVAVGCSIAVQRCAGGLRECCMRFTMGRMCVCVYVLEYVDLFKASSSGDFGIHLLLVCYQHTSFSNCAASDTVHKPATASLKSPLSQNSSGPLCDAQESLSHQATPLNLPQPQIVASTNMAAPQVKTSM